MRGSCGDSMSTRRSRDWGKRGSSSGKARRTDLAGIRISQVVAQSWPNRSAESILALAPRSSPRYPFQSHPHARSLQARTKHFSAARRMFASLDHACVHARIAPRSLFEPVRRRMRTTICMPGRASPRPSKNLTSPGCATARSSGTHRSRASFVRPAMRWRASRVKACPRVRSPSATSSARASSWVRCPRDRARCRSRARFGSGRAHQRLEVLRSQRVTSRTV